MESAVIHQKKLKKLNWKKKKTVQKLRKKTLRTLMYSEPTAKIKTMTA